MLKARAKNLGIFCKNYISTRNCGNHNESIRLGRRKVRKIANFNYLIVNFNFFKEKRRRQKNDGGGGGGFSPMVTPKARLVLNINNKYANPCENRCRSDV